MPTFFEALNDLVARGVAFAAVTVVDTVGSVPQDRGSKMLVTADGRRGQAAAPLRREQPKGERGAAERRKRTVWLRSARSAEARRRRRRRARTAPRGKVKPRGF